MDIKSMPYDRLQEYVVEELHEKAFRARQLYEWIHVHLARSYDEMTNLPKALRERLASEAPLVALEKLECQISAEDGTRKYLFGLGDGEAVESVLMRYHYGISVCISSQVGCRMGCRFCASTVDGLVRSLEPSEMLDQIYAIQRDTGERVSNIVVMGMGEPLENYDNLLVFLSMISDSHGLNISARNITVSTCGIVPAIYALAEQKLQITLALSLHAADQDTRKKLMPVANKYELSEVMEAVVHYGEVTGRRVTAEYAIVSGQNDSDEDVKKLAALLGGKGIHLNLIPVNPVTESGFVPPSRREAEAFKNKLEKYGINVTIRREMGRDIDGACGQLRRRRK